MTDDCTDALEQMERGVHVWVKQVMLQPDPPSSKCFHTGYGVVTLSLPPRPEPAESGETEVVVYFVPYRRSYAVREYEEGISGPAGWIPVARVSVPWRFGQGLDGAEQ